jgi:hypothetical protein
MGQDSVYGPERPSRTEGAGTFSKEKPGRHGQLLNEGLLGLLAHAQRRHKQAQLGPAAAADANEGLASDAGLAACGECSNVRARAARQTRAQAPSSESPC